MRPLRDLSFRYKIPLRGSLLVIITAVLVTTSLIAREYDELRRDLVANATSIGRVLAKTLVTPISHDDVWRAFEIINTPFEAAAIDQHPQDARVIMILDARQRVYVSTHPRQYPVLTDPGRNNPDLRGLEPTLASLQEFSGSVIDSPKSDMLYMVTPIMADGVPLGSLVMGYSKDAFLPRFFAIAKRAALVTALVVAVLIPASWFWARRFATPLVSLAASMEQIGRRLPEDSEIKVEESSDEIGKLGTAFKLMVAELREKEGLKRQVMLSERLAAVGRLTAAIAHEVNNPLGGMLNAINTYKHHGKADPLTNRTLLLLERGLLQIKDTVSALLVEAKVESHPLARQDVEDVRTLVAPDAQGKGAHLAWENDIVESLPLPSTLIRQVLINLLLNAIHAVDEGGQVACHVYRDSARLQLRVKNDGAFIEREQMEYLFEPFWTNSEGGHGLGLWVTYQIVQQLQGEIAVESVPGETQFSVTIPIEQENP